MAAPVPEAARVPEGTRWHVVYTRPPSKLKLDGFLTLRYMPGQVIRRIFLSDADDSTVLAVHIVHRTNDVRVNQTLEVEPYVVEVGELVEDGLCSSTTGSLPPRSSIPARTSSALAPRSPTDQASIASVGTEWNVTYSSNPTKKANKTLDGVVRLVQKNRREQKVVLCDNEGKEIDELFLGGSKDITCGTTLKFGGLVVEVDGIKGIFSSVPEIVVINDSPINQKKFPRQHPKSSFQGKATNRVSAQDHVEREIKETIEASGTRRIRAPSKACGKQEILPKRRDIVQIINSCKRPVNSLSRETSSTANSCTRESVEREGTSMLSSTSGRQYEEDRSATLDCVDRIQKLNVGRTCTESYDDDCFYIEHDLIQQESRLGNNRPRSIINLDDQFDVVVEQHEMLAEKIEGEASPRTRKKFTKCSEEVKNILDDENFRVQDFWEGYKLYCFGHYSHCSRSKGKFLSSKMGEPNRWPIFSLCDLYVCMTKSRVVCLLHNEKNVRWGSKFDETVRQAWVMMEEYAKVCHGKDCTNLRLVTLKENNSNAVSQKSFIASRALMEEFEDVKKLSTSENGCLLLQLIKDDEHGTEHLYRHSRNIQIQSTNIFDQFRSRLNQAGSNLDNLMKSSGTSSENSSGILTDLDNRKLGSRNSYENHSVGNAAKFSAESRNKSQDWCESALPNFDLGI